MKRKILALLLSMIMLIGMLPTMAWAADNTLYVDNVSGDGHYADLAGAINAAQAGDTIKLLKDVENVSSISLPAGVTLDGDGHKISGASGIYINKGGGTVQNVVFENIHNDSDKQSAIYGNGLAGVATITGCTFDSCDWDAIQITPVADANINITGNTFKLSGANYTNAKRSIHIQSDKTQTPTNFSATITGNKFYDLEKLQYTGIECYYPSNWDRIKISGNFIDNPMKVCLGNTSNNSSFKSVPLMDKYLNGFVTNDMTTPVAIEVVAYSSDGYDAYLYQTVNQGVEAGYVAQIGKVLYKTLADAVAAVTDSTETTIKMIGGDSYDNINNPITIAAGQNIVLDLNGKTLSHDYSSAEAGVADAFITVKGSLTVKDTSQAADGKITAKQNVDWNTNKNTINVYSGTFTLESGTIENTSADGLAWPVTVGVWGSESEAVINGGTLHSTNYVPIRFYLQYGGKKTLTINGGNFISDSSRAIAVQFNDAAVA